LQQVPFGSAMYDESPKKLTRNGPAQAASLTKNLSKNETIVSSFHWIFRNKKTAALSCFRTPQPDE
jgi:hypothetical protein